jgi:hypothetical protein
MYVKSCLLNRPYAASAFALPLTALLICPSIEIRFIPLRNSVNEAASVELKV